MINVTRMWELPRGIYFGSFVQAWTKVIAQLQEQRV